MVSVCQTGIPRLNRVAPTQTPIGQRVERKAPGLVPPLPPQFQAFKFLISGIFTHRNGVADGGRAVNMVDLCGLVSPHLVL